MEEIDADLGLDPFESVRCSAKNNIGAGDFFDVPFQGMNHGVETFQSRL